MASAYRTVLTTPDQRLRIDVDRTGWRFRVERDGALIGTPGSLPELEQLLDRFGYTFADLIER